MNIDKVIKYCINEVNKRQQEANDCNGFDEWTETLYLDKQTCLDYVCKYQQIAEWLTELKQLRCENEQLKDDLDKAILYCLKTERRVLDFIFPDVNKHYDENNGDD